MGNLDCGVGIGDGGWRMADCEWRMANWRKRQIPGKSDSPKTKIPNKALSVIGYWCLEIIWDLDFGNWEFSPSFSFPLSWPLVPDGLPAVQA